MKHLDLFSGIGGFALAAQWCGMETVQLVEIDPFCQKVLQKNFEGVPIHGDIKTFAGEPFRGGIDIITGGFPCQPFSVAGKRGGDKDDRFLWHEMHRVIAEIRPSFVVCENVTGLLSMGIDGMLFDLENIGYATRTLIIPACAVSAPHRRDRVWILAYSNEFGRKTRREHAPNKIDRREVGNNTKEWGGVWSEFGAGGETATDSNSKRQLQQKGAFKNISGRISDGSNEVYADTNRTRFKGQGANGNTFHSATHGDRKADTSFYTVRGTWQDIEPTICRGNHGIPGGLDRHRGKRIAALGNAIVPQVAYHILRAIVESVKGETENA